jgi:hypothetical protein
MSVARISKFLAKVFPVHDEPQADLAFLRLGGL